MESALVSGLQAAKHQFCANCRGQNDEIDSERTDVDQAGQKLRYAAISVELPENAHSGRSMSIREVPGWQVRPVGVMNLLGASWRSLDQMGRV